MLNKILQEAKIHGFWTLQSSIIEQNIASIKLHQKCGFRIVGFREKISKDALGKWQNTIIMEHRNNIK